MSDRKVGQEGAQPSSNEKLSDERLQDIYGRVRSLAYPQQAIADMLALLAEIKLLRSADETPAEPPEPTAEMIRQGIWAWQRIDGRTTAQDVRAIYIAMRRMEGRSTENGEGK